MKIAFFIAATLAILGSAATATPTGTSEKTPVERMRSLQDGERVAVLCFKKGETVEGMNKICFYDCLGSGSAITVGAGSLCPLTIDN